MTDKQIIINEVNVAGCEYFNRFRNICHNENLCCDCEKNQDCYYKQLKRKEQELQQAMDNYVQLDLQRVKEYNELVDLYKAKEQKYKAYKQTLTEIKEIAKPYCNACSEFWRGKGKHCKYCNYSKILQKISEVLDDGTK